MPDWQNSETGTQKSVLMAERWPPYGVAPHIWYDLGTTIPATKRALKTIREEVARHFRGGTNTSEPTLRLVKSKRLPGHTLLCVSGASSYVFTLALSAGNFPIYQAGGDAETEDAEQALNFDVLWTNDHSS